MQQHLHVIPLHDILVHRATLRPLCWCRPTPLREQGGVIWLHHALDLRGNEAGRGGWEVVKGRARRVRRVRREKPLARREKRG